jgi:AmmeMemoRadiSam system protein B
MRIRESSLPAGWYPRNPSEITASISRFLQGFNRSSPFSRAAIAPHAGWYYSGRLASCAIASLEPDTETIIVLGGHLPAGSSALFAMEDAVETPLGNMLIDAELRTALQKQLNGKEDRFRDNTVEVLLPMVKHFFPKAHLIWLRLPAEIESFEAGKSISQVSKKINRKVNVLASVDLTHYGMNYGFSPQGSGNKALRWVREVNDAGFIQAVEAGNANEVLQRGERDKASCSAGAALGVMGFADAEGLGKARLLEYATSADITGEEEPDSFVGYAAMVFGG